MPVDGDDDTCVDEDDDARVDEDDGSCASPSSVFITTNGDDGTCANNFSSHKNGNKGDCVDAAIRIITSHPAPLVIYVFTEREGVKERCEYFL